MIKSLLISPTSSPELGGEELIEQWKNNDDSFLWLDLEGLDKAKEKKIRLSLTKKNPGESS